MRDLEQSKPAAQSISSYVRSVLQQEVSRRKMAAAAEQYARFLNDSAEERTWLEQWDRADLATPARRKRR